MAEVVPVSSWGICAPLSRAQFEQYKVVGIEALHAQLLYNRGMNVPAEARKFLDARYDQLLDPLLLNDMGKAIERIRHALETGEHITVYGDFDADGVTSAALLIRALRRLKQPGAPLDYFIPHRLEHTRGLSNETLGSIIPRGTALLITTDCGSSDVAEVEYASSRGVDVIITDHHRPPPQLPPAYAVINPWRADNTYPEQFLCGAGIAFKLAQALFKAYGREEEVRDLLDLVALGTISDVAYMLGENHTLVRLGLEQLNTTTNAGLRALVQAAGLQGRQLRERDISYALGPRINAAGRMEHAGIAVELLTTEDEAEAQARAQELEALNQSRQQITEALMQRVREQARGQEGNAVILVSGNKKEWPEGIIGLVAGRLSEEIHRPVFVLSMDSETSRGSGRSQGDFNIIEALRQRADLFERHGGHAQAAGFTIANEKIEELHRHLLAWQSSGNGGETPPVVDETLAPDLAVVVPEPESIALAEARKVDLVITNPEAQINYDTYLKINQLAPFGTGNPEPAFRLNGALITRRWISGAEGKHLRLRLRVNEMHLNATFLRAGPRIEAYPEGAHVNIIFNLEPQWNAPGNDERHEVWLKVMAMEIAGAV
jgi:single-stranded-DNA-specific exonuclease